VVDQIQFLLAQPVTRASGHLHTFVDTRTGDDGAEPVTVDDAAWATLETSAGVVASVEVTRMATGRKNGLTIEVYGSRGSVAFDLERLNELQVVDATGDPQGSRRVLVTEEEHPYLEAWWPPGHILGWDHTFTSQAADFLRAIASDADPSPSFADGLSVQRVLAAIEDSAAGSGAAVDVMQED
jgi:predicted dehydrogenase